MATPSTPAPQAAPQPAAAAEAAPQAMTLKPDKSGRPKPPRSMAQQRFVLTIVALVSLLGSLYVTAVYMTGDFRTAILTILTSALAGPLRDAFRHYFPGGKADQPDTPAK
jgi:hypothetical protein